MKLYLDTNIYVNFLRNEQDKLRPLGEFAFQIFKRSVSCEFEIVFSDFIATELNNIGISSDNVNNLLSWIGTKVIIVKSDKQDVNQARKVQKKLKIHFSDALHYAIAMRTADKVLTSDNEFKQLPNCFGYETI